MKGRGAALLLLLCFSGSFAISNANAAEPAPPQQCTVMRNGALPVCEYIDGQWVAHYPDRTSTNPGGIGAPFIALIVIAGVVGVGVTVWRLSLARSLAREAGVNPDTATALTLIGSEGLDAAYVATGLARKNATQTGASPEQRLTELKTLLDRGLITQSEYETRRSAIVETL